MPLLPGLAAPTAALLVFLDDEDPFLAEQDDVFVAEHGSSAASAAGCPVGESLSMWKTAGNGIGALCP
ncbi:hypothetical protein [Arthrobacter sp. S39]|uniref:hypothetical protein n=1 Tax=Arthrobacter sp. S39 TaxID=2509720 RepID=UPI0010370CDE|nr:hypothetical protein [Arthrobacter sp. S39]TAP45855.1 hypothetical protein EYS21_03905 [Arthrobacter sp. S39]